MGRKAQEIQRVGSLWNVRCRKLAEIHVLGFPGDSNVHKETENPDSSQGGETSINTSHESLIFKSLYSTRAGSTYNKVSGDLSRWR